MADAQLAPQLGGQRPALLFCGDLNSDLNDGIPGAIELLSKGRLPADFWDWSYGAAFKWEKGEEGANGDSEGLSAALAVPAAAAGNAGGEFGEVLKQVNSAVDHAHPPGSTMMEAAAAETAAGRADGQQQQQDFVVGVDLQIPFE